MYAYVPEIGVCGKMSLPRVQYRDDTMVVSDRLSTEAQLHLLSAVEVVLMLSIIIVGNYRAKPPYLPTSLLALPGLILIGVIAVRMRHTGILGCAKGDPECCANMLCSDLPMTTTLPPGCDKFASRVDTITINWRNRSSYCIVPSWYVEPAPTVCGGLYGTPDTNACYQYGCSSESTAIPYYSGRLIMGNAILFAFLACRR